MTTSKQLMDQMDKVLESNAKSQASLEKAMKRKLNTVYVLIVRLLSLLAFAGCLYTAFLGFAGSAAVLGSLFLVSWMLYLVAYVIVGATKNYAEGKEKELQLEVERLKDKNNVPLV